ncbi:unnamed protein product [Ixodes pacificus]
MCDHSNPHSLNHVGTENSPLSVKQWHGVLSDKSINFYEDEHWDRKAPLFRANLSTPPPPSPNQHGRVTDDSSTGVLLHSEAQSQSLC